MSTMHRTTQQWRSSETPIWFWLGLLGMVAGWMYLGCGGVSGGSGNRGANSEQDGNAAQESTHEMDSFVASDESQNIAGANLVESNTTGIAKVTLTCAIVKNGLLAPYDFTIKDFTVTVLANGSKKIREKFTTHKALALGSLCKNTIEDKAGNILVGLLNLVNSSKDIPKVVVSGSAAMKTAAERFDRLAQTNASSLFQVSAIDALVKSDTELDGTLADNGSKRKTLTSILTFTVELGKATNELITDTLAQTIVATNKDSVAGELKSQYSALSSSVAAAATTAANAADICEQDPNAAGCAKSSETKSADPTATPTPTNTNTSAPGATATPTPIATATVAATATTQASPAPSP